MPSPLLLPVLLLVRSGAAVTPAATDGPAGESAAGVEAAALPQVASPVREAALYRGHSVVTGERVVPILGRLETRTDTWVLARIHTDPDGRVIVTQVPCALEVKPVAGVKVQIDPASVPRLPPASFVLAPGGTASDGTAPAGAGALVAPAWHSGWDRDDIDADGLPGVTIDVRAPLCGGALQVASDTHSTARAAWQGDELAGTLSVEVEQRILDAQGACLRMVAKDSVERMSGTFRYAPTTARATCSDAPRSAWPDAAPEGS